MGYDGLYFGRNDYQDYAIRMKNRTLEMMWKGSDDLGSVADIFTGKFYDSYGPPGGFCFDSGCADEPIMVQKI